MIRNLFLGAIIVGLAGAGALEACSSSSSPPARSDAGPDATGPVDGGTGDGQTDAGDAGTGDDATDVGTVTIATDAGTPISPQAFGQNYWDWEDWSHNGLTGLTGTEPLVQALGLNVIRAGGDNNDNNNPALFDTTQIDKFVAYCRSVGAEPILQVPIVVNNEDGGAPTPATAADMVTYANVTKGYGIKYWEIGNEPDVYSQQYDAGVPFTAADYCTTFHAYASAMRAANAAGPDGGAPMQLLGPELAYAYSSTDWLTPFLDGCKDDVDVVTVHRYPYGYTPNTVHGDLSDVNALRSTLTSLANIVKNHARPGTPFGITEANISYQYDITKYADASLSSAPGTYYAAMWTADTMGAALENGLWTLAFWNIGEQQASDSVLGFIVTQQPTPQYYAEQLVSANFKGTEITPTGVPANFSVYASHDPAAAVTRVLVINKTSTTSRMTLAVDALTPQAFDFPELSLTLVTIADAPGTPAHVVRYTGDDADAGTGPVTIQ